MKMPKLPKIAFPRRQKRLNATTSARRAPAADDYYDEEPKTNLSSAFVVVLILHVVAVGGIYAFNSIKAARRGSEPRISATAPSSNGTPLAAKATAPLPDGLNTAATAPAKGGAAAPAPATTGAHVYSVKAGDNLTKIATLHGVSVPELEEANSIKASANLRPGQTLAIPVSKSPTKAAPAVAPETRKSAFLATRDEPAPVGLATPRPLSAKPYIVVKGDTATSIGRRYGISAEELLKLNKIEDAKKLRLGLALKVPAKKSN